MCSERRWYISDKYSGLHHSCNCELLQCKERAQNSAAIVSMPQEYQARQMTAHCMPCLLGTAREDSLPYDRMSQGTFGGGGGGGGLTSTNSIHRALCFTTIRGSFDRC